jgi:hypothetical protein
MSQRMSESPSAAWWPAGMINPHAAGMVLLFVLEGLVFYSQLANRIVPFHPTYFDQTGYYLETYHLLDAFQTQGWKALIGPILRPDSSTGITFPVQGALLAMIGGPNRIAIVTLNLVYFFALQVALFRTVLLRFQSASLAWTALGLLVSLGTHFNFAGGIFDFRIDFSALCIFGIWTCLVIRSERFRDLTNSLLITAVGVWLIAMRFFTIAYLGLIFSGMLAALLIVMGLASDPVARQDSKRSIRNLLISGLLTAALALPFLLAVRRLLYEYYGIGHFLGNEKDIRAAESQIYSLYDHLTYYPHSILQTHLGPITLWLFLAVAAVALTLALLSGWTSFLKNLRGVRALGFEFVVIVLAICMPLALLTVDVGKSPVVGGVVVVPVILLVTMLCAPLWPGPGNPVDARPSRRFAWTRCGAAAASIIVLAVGFAGFAGKAATEPRDPSRLVREQWVAINEAIARFVVENKLVRPKISFDRVADHLNVGTISIYGYERYRQRLAFVPRFGVSIYGIFATPRDVAMQLISDSDIVILTDPTIAREHPYPMNTKIKEYWDDIRQWTNDNLALVLSENIAGLPHQVFARPGVRIGGATGDGWITSAGLSVGVDASHLTRWPIIVLHGIAVDDHYALLGGVPKARAVVVEGRNRDGRELPVTFRRSGHAYTVIIEAHAIAAATSERKEIRLSFDRHFVPSRVASSPDARELVLRAPGVSTLQAAPPN